MKPGVPVGTMIDDTPSPVSAVTVTRHRLVGAAYLLDSDAQCREVGAGTAVLLVKHQPEQA